MDAPDHSPAPTPKQPTDYGRIGRPRSVGLTILVSILTLGIWTWVWSFMNGEELRAYRNQGLGGVGYLLITILFNPITMFLMAYEVENLYREQNEEPRITVLWGFWFLLPIIGNFVWYIRMQHAINAFWQARGGTALPGL